MNHARVQSSPRLLRVLSALATGEWITHRDLSARSQAKGLRTCICELRRNGFTILSRGGGARWEYKLETKRHDHRQRP